MARVFIATALVVPLLTIALAASVAVLDSGLGWVMGVILWLAVMLSFLWVVFFGSLAVVVARPTDPYDMFLRRCALVVLGVAGLAIAWPLLGELMDDGAQGLLRPHMAGLVVGGGAFAALVIDLMRRDELAESDSESAAEGADSGAL
jgi:hypothetical protein